MSTEVSATSAEAARAELLRLAKQVAPPSSNRISTKGKQFTFPDGKQGPGPINAIVLDFAAVNSYYPGPYNPNNKAPPDCFAVGQVLDELAPSTRVKKPQATDCASCPKNQWKSSPTGNSKACKNTRRLLVLPVDFTDRSDPLTLYISPTGLKSWDGYIRRIVADYTARPIDVVTQISFDANQTYPTLQFDFVEMNKNVALAEKIRARSMDLLLREPESQALAA